MAHDFRFGIEEEFFLADGATGRTPASGDADRFHAVAADAVKPCSHELLKGQVEICTEPGPDLDAAHHTLLDLRRRLSGLAADQRLSLFAAGSHPLADSRDQSTSDGARYQALQDEFGIIATRSMVCATHIHVEVPDAERRIDIMNRLVPYLPLCLALSVSSPFWQGRDSGLQGFRLVSFSEWPRMGLPEIFASQADYDRFVALLVDAGMMKDASFIWWLIRPSTHYPTVELRICDGCTDVRDTVAIAALYRCLVRAVTRDPERHPPVDPIARGLCAENIWQAQRAGLQARFVDAASGAAVSVADRLEATLDLVAEDADALGCGAWLDRARTIVSAGTSADRQRATYRDAAAAGADRDSALRAVVAMLGTATIA